MKYKLTKNDNFKVTMTGYEVSVITALMSYVRLGTGESSDVAYDWLTLFKGEVLDRMDDVKFDYTEDEGFMINV